jgi:lipoate-protein ligase A
MGNLRLLIDPPASGPWNMAVDEVLLETAASAGMATLRFYEWQEPTLSLGYFQAVADRDWHTASRECPLVRRASGGGAIVHDCELTYCIALPRANAQSSTAAELYNLFHETLVATLGEFGVAAAVFRPGAGQCDTDTAPVAVAEPFLCFQRRSCGDIVCSGAKIVGSAQRRRRAAVLQHGSILLARSAAAPELPGIGEISAVSIARVELTTVGCRRSRRLAAPDPGVTGPARASDIRLSGTLRTIFSIAADQPPDRPALWRIGRIMVTASCIWGNNWAIIVVLIGAVATTHLAWRALPADQLALRRVTLTVPDRADRQGD